MTLMPPQWAMNRAWDENPILRATYDKLCTSAGAHEWPDWVDTGRLTTGEFSYDREIIDRLSYEYRTVQRELIKARIKSRAAELDHYARLKEQWRRLEEKSGLDMRIVAKLNKLHNSGRKTVRIADLLNGDTE